LRGLQLYPSIKPRVYPQLLLLMCSTDKKKLSVAPENNQSY
jgi:hypothetical protein